MGGPPKSQEEINALIAKKRAEVLSRIASMNLPTSGGASAQRPTAPPQQQLAAQPAKPLDQASLQDTIAATRARIEAKLKGQNLGGSTNTAPPPIQTQPKQQTHAQELHPMLRGDYKPLGHNAKRAKLSTMPRISSIKANQRKEPPRQLKIEREAPASFMDPEKNPYYDTHMGGRPKAEPQTRKHAKQFHFVRPGQFVAQAEKQRAEAKMEQLKAEIAERAAKARLAEEVLDVTAIRPPEPPGVEWWDMPFLSNDESYDSAFKLDGADSLVTVYVQHPVPIEPPEPIRAMSVAPSQLILTRKERKKIRRQRRLDQQREHREKVMLGLEPPEKPKLRMSNFMHVMATQSVPDPTKLEAEVRKQMGERLEKHNAQNQARKLTKEQRKEKAESKAQEAEARDGLVCAVFKMDKLSHPQHKYKVTVNANQMNLTGCALVCPQMSVVVVEGAAKFVKAYKKLMLRRIDWTDSQPKLDSTAHTSLEQMPLHQDQEASEDQVDYSDNVCHLIWQGEVEKRRFTQFRLRKCPAEIQAKSWLAGAGCDTYWQLAKQYDPNDNITALDPFA
ncbi:U4/U5/U6 small nuclear ribonucleoprotein prp3 [Coemansia sp. RSA 1813]|nr:U4/U5/U6 small nuclear ribonucleoprotein prp3 [Coemansia sp. RSA 1843]KAJ2567200.1 U4/U5/U6 small nuclear ribonucleoprotein prp3 [Coemansia sp. RSA 1813]